MGSLCADFHCESARGFQIKGPGVETLGRWGIITIFTQAAVQVVDHFFAFQEEADVKVLRIFEGVVAALFHECQNKAAIVPKDGQTCIPAQFLHLEVPFEKADRGRYVRDC